MPRTLGGLCNLTDLRLNSNNFNGELADVVDGLSSCSGGAALSYLSFEGNKFNDIIPSNLGQFSGRYRLDLSSNSLEGDSLKHTFSEHLDESCKSFNVIIPDNQLLSYRN
ncbi:unnamed protein product [Musa hybrid cultivar]